MDLEGGCLCGAVRYRISGPVLRQVVCHCRDCQRASGSAFHVGIVVAQRDFSLTRGTPRTYRRISDAGRWIDRSFCPECGSGLLHELELSPGRVVVKSGTLDDPTPVRPTFEIFAASRQAWVSIAGETTTLDGMVEQRPSGADSSD